jgi:hypothetical protein
LPAAVRLQGVEGHGGGLQRQFGGGGRRQAMARLLSLENPRSRPWSRQSRSLYSKQKN